MSLRKDTDSLGTRMKTYEGAYRIGLPIRMPVIIRIECNNKNNSELQELCFQKGINWNFCPIPQKRGRAIVKVKTFKSGTNPVTGEEFNAERSDWVVDNTIPIFSEDREYYVK